MSVGVSPGSQVRRSNHQRGRSRLIERVRVIHGSKCCGGHLPNVLFQVPVSKASRHVNRRCYIRPGISREGLDELLADFPLPHVAPIQQQIAGVGQCITESGQFLA